MTTTRRQFLAQTGGFATAALAGACADTSLPPARLRVMMNGGLYEELARRLVIEPFERDSGARVEVVPASAAQIVTRLMAERSAPTVDAVIVDQLVMGEAVEAGLFEQVDAAGIPNLRDLAPTALDPRGYGPVVHSHNLVIGYNTRLLAVDPPRSWADLWEPRFKGTVVPGAIELTPGLLFLLQANAQNGGSYDNVDPGFAAVARLAPNVRKYFHNIGEVRPLVSQQNVVVAISSNMLQVEIAQGSPVGMVFPSEGCLASPAVAQVVRGTKVKALAEQFIDHYLQPAAQSGWAKDYNVSVFNTKAAVPDEVKARIADRVVFFDAREVARRRGDWVDRWMRERSGADVAVVRIERLRKSFAGRTVLDLDELDIRDGEFFSLLGPSGCGKTTTLRSIAGLVEPDGGRVFIGGRDMTTVPTWQRNLGMVFQKYALFPHLTIAENIAYGLEERRVARADIRMRIGEALSLVALSGTEDRYPHQLSGGQQQRVAMARAVVYRPDVLLLDEPLSNLDVKLRVAMRAELKRLQQAVGITTVFVTHDQHEALALSDRIGVMRDGRMEQVGTPQEIYDAPQSVFVADFVGGTNLLQAVIRQADTIAGTVTIEVEGSGLVILNMTRPLKAGQHVRIAAKPERVGLEPMPAATDGLRGTIESAAYLGAGYSYVIAVGAQKLEARRTTPLPIDGYPAATGEPVLVTFDRESSLVFDV